MDKPKRQYYQCSCGSEVLVLEDFLDGEMSFAILRRRPQRTFRDKLRWIWNILTEDEIYCDDLLIGQEDIRGIIKFLKSCEVKNDKT